MDYFNKGIAQVTLLFNRSLSVTQNGKLRFYVMAITIGIALILNLYDDQMILSFISLIILLAGGILSMVVQKWSTTLCRIISLAAITFDLLILINIFYLKPIAGDRTWIIEYSSTWISHFGISLHLAVDGLSLLLLLLTFFLGFLSVVNLLA